MFFFKNRLISHQSSIFQALRHSELTNTCISIGVLFIPQVSLKKSIGFKTLTGLLLFLLLFQRFSIDGIGLSQTKSKGGVVLPRHHVLCS